MPATPVPVGSSAPEPGTMNSEDAEEDDDDGWDSEGAALVIPRGTPPAAPATVRLDDETAVALALRSRDVGAMSSTGGGLYLSRASTAWREHRRRVTLFTNEPWQNLSPATAEANKAPAAGADGGIAQARMTD
jgi:hypothetical protein